MEGWIHNTYHSQIFELYWIYQLPSPAHKKKMKQKQYIHTIIKCPFSFVTCTCTVYVLKKLQKSIFHLLTKLSHTFTFNIIIANMFLIQPLYETNLFCHQRLRKWKFINVIMYRANWREAHKIHCSVSLMTTSQIHNFPIFNRILINVKEDVWSILMKEYKI